MKLILIATFLWSFTATYNYAAQLSFIGPCDSNPLVQIEFNANEGETVGSATIEQLNTAFIPYLGTERGLNSIFNTPIGIDAIELVSEQEYLAYGWCYSVNGFEPSNFPNEYAIAQDDKILWWFGYAHFKDGKWITQCRLSYLRQSAQFCSN